MKTRSLFLLLTCSLILITSCDEMPPAPETDNPMDSDNPDYRSPLATLVSGPSEGQTITDFNVSFTWIGEEAASSFAYFLDGHDSEWSSWDSTTSVSYSRLWDEQSYTFQVREKYATGDEQTTPTTRSFIVDYADPLVMITSGPEDGTTITEAAASFSWVGQGLSSEFSFTLEGFDTDWSGWSTETTVSYTDLDDRSYTFKVIERYSNADEQQSVTTRTFLVDAVTGPALVMYRRFVSTKIGLRFQVEVLVEDIAGMMGADVNIAFDPSLLQFESATEGIFLATGQHSGTLFIATAPDSTNARGSLEIIVSRLGGNPVGVTGNGRLALLEFTALSTGESQITFEPDECQVRNEANQDIILNDIIHCRVVVTE